MTPPDAKTSPRGERLRAYLASAQSPMIWGVDDCTMWAAKWFSSETKITLNLPSYNSEDRARELIAKAGGLVNLWTERLDRCGATETFEPVLGDVGIVRLSYGDVGCIHCQAGIVACRTRNGVTFLSPRESLVSWSVE